MTDELEFRTRPYGVEVRSVSFPKRIIEVVAMPYDQEATVEHRGRMIQESVAPGAFGTIATRPNRVKVNRDHDLTRVCGSALTLHPNRPEGLVAELLMSKSDLGQETLVLADEGLLDASAGFCVRERNGRPGEEWPERNRRRLTWLWLDHIAMTPIPAYEGAQTLSVRTQDEQQPAGGVVVTTPNLDVARALRQQDLYARLSR